MKRKYLKNLYKEIDLRRININIKKRSVENNKRKLNINLHTINYNDKNNPEKTSKDKEKSLNKRSYSKPNYNTINQIKNKSNISNRKGISLNKNKISIYSNDIEITNDYPNSKEVNTKIKIPKNIVKRNNNNDISKTNSYRALNNLSFNQSIEKKKKMLGIGFNLQNKIINDNNDIHLKIYNIKEKIYGKNDYINNDEDIISNHDDIDYKINPYDALSHPSINTVPNPLDNNSIKYNHNIQNNFSLMSIFSNKSNKTSIPTTKIIKKRNLDINKENYNARIIKMKNTNNEIIIKKQEKNKNFLNSIRIIKKRGKNNNKEKNNPINCINNINNNKENITDTKNKIPKLYEK